MKPHPVRSASLIFTLTLFLFLPPLLYAAEVTEQDLRDAITGKRTFTQEELNAMDLNMDGQVDVADLVSISTIEDIILPKEIPGNIWLASISFSTDQSKRILPLNYEIAIRIERESSKGVIAEVTTIPAFDPTKGILAQSLSQPGEEPGKRREKFSLSGSIPSGTPFSYVEDNDSITLASENIVTKANAPGNPFRVKLERRLEIIILKKSLSIGGIVQGTVKETIRGVLPQNKYLTHDGEVTLALFAKTNLEPISAL